MRVLWILHGLLKSHLVTKEITMNKGGFSWKTFFGITAQKKKISKIIQIPITKSGRKAKLGSLIYKLFKWK